MAESVGVPLLALLENLHIRPDPKLGGVEALAFQIQRHRRDAASVQEEVSRTSLLHACGLIQPAVFTRLAEAGWDRATWEREIGVQGVSFEIPSTSSYLATYVKGEDLTPILERYAAAFPGRRLDALGLAWAIVAQNPKAGSVGQRLLRAGLNRETAEALLAKDVAVEIGLVPIEGLDLYSRTPVVSDAIEKAMALARQRGPGVPLTASFLLLGLVEQGAASTVDDSTALLARKLWTSDPSRFGSEVEEYLSWYGEQQSGQTPLRWMTRRVGEIFEQARELSKATRRRSLVNARSLLGALLAYRAPEDTNPLGAHLLLERLGSSAQDMIDELLLYLRTHAPAEGGDNLKAWEDFFRSTDDLESGPSSMARVDAESLDGKDLLRIESDVMAFALLIASANLTPPLAIGLFGNWGAGKSFFMKKLFERIASLARKARERRPQGLPTPLHEQIVQIELNAWHYEETNLWASMITHIFESLHQHFAPSSQREREQWAELLKRLSEASLEQDGAKDALARANEDLLEAREAHDARKLELGKVMATVWASITSSLGTEEKKDLAEALALPDLDALKEDLLLRRREALELRDRMALHRQTLIRMLGKPAALGSLAAVLVGSLGLATLAALLDTEAAQRALGTVAQVLAFAGGISAWLGSAFRKASGVLGAFDRLQETVRVQVENSPEAEQLRAAETAVELARRKLEEQQTQVETLRAEVAALRPGQRLLRFLEDRAGSSDYRKHLGLPALVRRDFEQLQRLLSQEILLDRADAELDLDALRVPKSLLGEIEKIDLPLSDSATVSQVGSGWEVKDPSNEREFWIKRPDADSDKLRCRVVWTKLPRIDRIVLYIDDLDRCPPDRVVEVLRAIQLLLAFPLFVVVVGVDARWVKRALSVRYKGQLRPLREGTWDGATPQDYIEKIFQIPFWLEPMSATSTRDYLKGLLSVTPRTVRRGDTGAQAGSGGQADSTEEATETASGSPGGTAAGQGSSTASQTSPASSPAGTTLRSTGSGAEPEEEPLPDLLEIEPLEQDFMLALAPLVRRTPRSVKRFVNIYRLYRASQAKGRLEAFLGRNDAPGPFREALVLLALLSAAPDIAPQVFSYFSNAPGNTLEEALDAIDRTTAPFSAPSWAALTKDLKDLTEALAANEAPPLLMKTIRDQLAGASRYSFLEMPPL